MKDQHIVVPPKKHETKTEGYEGAYVKDPQIGRHKWVASFDLNSLYPHLIMQYNISPETLMGMYPESGLVDALLGCFLVSFRLSGLTLARFRRGAPTRSFRAWMIEQSVCAMVSKSRSRKALSCMT